jgi:hypothetical protein
VGPIITFDHDAFVDTVGYYIQEVTAPNNTWPSTASVSFDGMISGDITMAQFDAILTKIFDQHNDPTLGLVLDYITPAEPYLVSLSPSFGVVTGGNSVTISGSGFIGSTVTVNFGDTVATSTVIDDNTISAIAPPGTGTVDVTVTTPFGTTPIITADQYTYVAPGVLPPTDFKGGIRTQLNKSWYVLQATWVASVDPDVVMYRIYYEDTLVDEVIGTLPLFFSTCIETKLDALKFTIVSVNLSNEESPPLTLVIKNE